MDLDVAADELYAGLPDDFMARRTARVAEARAAGDRPLAKAIGQLRKPTRSAWLVNLLAREAADDLDSLLQIGAALRQAQAELSGPDLRRLSHERQRAIEALSRRAAALGVVHGYAASDSGVQEVSQTLQAALADESVADVVRAGRVTQSVTYGGFGPLDLTAGTARGEGPPAEPEASTDLDEARRRPSAAELTAAGAAVETAEATLAAAQREATDAADHADTVQAELADLRQRVADLERADELAREAVRSAQERLAPLREEAERLRGELAQLTAQ